MNNLSREDFFATVRLEDMDGDLRDVAEHCGIENAVRLWNTFQGARLKKAAIRYIRERYDGTNIVELVRATGFAERFIYEVVGSAPVKNDQYRLV
jgi:hypothetical protein